MEKRTAIEFVMRQLALEDPILFGAAADAAPGDRAAERRRTWDFRLG